MPYLGSPPPLSNKRPQPFAQRHALRSAEDALDRADGALLVEVLLGLLAERQGAVAAHGDAAARDLGHVTLREVGDLVDAVARLPCTIRARDVEPAAVDPPARRLHRLFGTGTEGLVQVPCDAEQDPVELCEQLLRDVEAVSAERFLEDGLHVMRSAPAAGAGTVCFGKGTDWVDIKTGLAVA